MREKMALSMQDLNRPLLDKRHLLCQPATALSNASGDPLSPSVSFSKTGKYFRTTFVMRKHTRHYYYSR